MHYNADQIVNGIVNYADSEVMGKLPTMGKWVVGTGIGLASAKAKDVVDNLRSNSMMITLGIVDGEGKFDVDTIAESLKESASRYGKAQVDIPLVGKLTFSEEDVDILKQYIERSAL